MDTLSRDLCMIKDNDTHIKIKNEIILDEVISQTIALNTFKLKASKFQLSRINKLLKANSLYENLVTNNNKHLLNKMPYLLFGVVESTFIDEKKSEKTKEYGCGILIDSNIVLLPAKNLVFDSSDIETTNEEEKEENEEKKEKKEKEEKEEKNDKEEEKNKSKEQKEKFNFKLFEVEFKPLNISPEYRAYLPKAIKAIDHYTPLNDSRITTTENADNGNEGSKNNYTSENEDEVHHHESNLDEEGDEGMNEINDEGKDNIGDTNEKKKLLNGWGLAFLEYPIGDILNYIYTQICQKEFGKNYKKKPMYNNIKKDDISIIESLEIKHLSNEELEKCQIHYLECLPKENANEETDSTNEDINEFQSSSIYDFHESYYNLSFDSKVIYLDNPNQELQEEEDILPGFIIGYYMKRYYILGMNTNIMIKYTIDNEDNKEGEENKSTNDNNENNENNENNVTEESRIYHIAIRFNKKLSETINQKIAEFKERYQNDIDFNMKIFDLLSKSIKTKSDLFSLLKNNCDNLYKLLNQLKNNKSLTSIEKKILDISNDKNLKFISFALSMLFNKFSSSVIESKIVDIENLKIGFFPGSDIISEIIQSKDNLMTLNLKNNELYSTGIKQIMQPIFNKRKILDIGKVLKCICLDSNKLDGKALKYIRYLIKVSPQLSFFTLSNNYITGSSLRHLINATKGKDLMEILYLNSNMLGESCGSNLSTILSNLPNLHELNLSGNSFGDMPIPIVLDTLKERCKVENLQLSKNDIGKASAESIAKYLSNNRVLKTLWINSNPLGSEGIKKISQALSTKISLEEINLSSTDMGDEGGKELFENLKMNKSIKRLYANCNKIEKLAMEKFGELMKMDNQNENSEGGIEMISLSMNAINDECVKLFYGELMNYRWLKELKLNSNCITDEGGELMLYVALQNKAITKLNLENNQTTWVIDNENFKMFRSDLQLFL